MIKLFRGLSLKNKLVSIIFLVTLSTLLVSFAFFVGYSYFNLRNDLLNRSTTTARLVSDYAISPLMFDDKNGGSDILSKLGGIPEIDQAVILDKNNLHFATYSRDSSEIVTSFTHQETRFEGSYLHVFEPIYFQGEKLGSIYIRASNQPIIDKAKNEIITVGGLLIVILGLSLLFSRYMQHSISQPILQLTKVTQQIAEGGDYSIRAPKVGEDEIGQLYDRFNLLLAAIEQERSREQKAASALRMSEENYKNIFQNSMVGIFRISRSTGCVLQANKLAWEIFKIQPDYNRKLLPAILSSQAIFKLLRHIAWAKMLDNYEVSIDLPGSRKIWLSISGQLSQHGDFFEGVVQDITESKDNFDELQKVNFELDNFVYHASHDMRSPLRSILGLVNISRSEKVVERLSEVLDRIEGSVIRLDRLITDLLSFSRNSRLDQMIDIVDLRQLTQTCLENIDLQTREKVSISIDIKEYFPFKTDKTRMSVILNNLISNAFKYQREEEKNPKIYIRAVIYEQKAQITVEDNGEGISPDYQEKVFEMFYRASERSEGSGLGLYIVKNVLEKLGGQIYLASQVGVGTTFSVEIPNNLVKQESPPQSQLLT